MKKLIFKSNLNRLIFLTIFLIFVSSFVFAQENSSEQVTQLIERLKDDNKEIRHKAAYDLADIGKPALPALLKELENERADAGQNEMKRAQVIHSITIALGMIGDKSTASYLFNLLEDKDGNVIIYATESLCMMRDESIVSKLIKIVSDKVKSMERIKQGSTGVSEEEVASRISPYMISSTSITTGISNSGETMIPVLLKTLDNEDWEVRDYAVKLLFEIVSASPNSSSYHQILKDALMARVHDENPKVAETARKYLTELDIKNEKQDEAISRYDMAIEKIPDANNYVARGEVYCDKGNFYRAIIDFNKAIEIDPEFARAYVDRGNAYYSEGDFNRAIVDFSKAIEIDPKDGKTYNNRAAAYLSKQDYDKAWQDVHRVEELGEQPMPELLEGLKEASGRQN